MLRSFVTWELKNHKQMSKRNTNFIYFLDHPQFIYISFETLGSNIIFEAYP